MLSESELIADKSIAENAFVTLAAHFNVQTCLDHAKELFSRTGNKKRPSTTNSLKKTSPNLKPHDITSRAKPETNEW